MFQLKRAHVLIEPSRRFGPVLLCPEPDGGNAGFAVQEFSENRLVRESQLVGYLFDVEVCAFKQLSCIVTYPFRNVETDGASSDVLHDA